MHEPFTRKAPVVKGRGRGEGQRSFGYFCVLAAAAAGENRIIPPPEDIPLSFRVTLFHCGWRPRPFLECVPETIADIYKGILWRVRPYAVGWDCQLMYLDESREGMEGVEVVMIRADVGPTP